METEQEKIDTLEKVKSSPASEAVLGREGAKEGTARRQSCQEAEVEDLGALCACPSLDRAQTVPRCLSRV